MSFCDLPNHEQVDDDFCCDGFMRDLVFALAVVIGSAIGSLGVLAIVRWF